jgi:hypothetical protein
MNFEIKTKDNSFLTVKGAKSIEHWDNDGIYFKGDTGQTLLYVPFSNLAYYEQK